MGVQIGQRKYRSGLIALLVNAAVAVVLGWRVAPEHLDDLFWLLLGVSAPVLSLHGWDVGEWIARRWPERGKQT